jgi:RNA polymerase sigma-70 factor (ECF subfamily)
VGTNRNDDGLVGALLTRDERVFSDLVERCSGIMLQLALARVQNRAIAEEVVQDAWLTMLRSLDQFAGRSSFRTWLLGIVVNLARSRARAERRAIRMPGEPERCPTPEEDLLAGEIRGVILKTIDALPPTQREVMVLRDVDGLSATDVCHLLGLADTNQRVLLHRARSRVRLAIEEYFMPTKIA